MKYHYQLMCTRVAEEHKLSGSMHPPQRSSRPGRLSYPVGKSLSLRLASLRFRHTLSYGRTQTLGPHTQELHGYTGCLRLSLPAEHYPKLHLAGTGAFSSFTIMSYRHPYTTTSTLHYQSVFELLPFSFY